MKYLIVTFILSINTLEAINLVDSFKISIAMCEYKRQHLEFNENLGQMLVVDGHFNIFEYEDSSISNFKSFFLTENGLFIIIYNKNKSDSLIKKICNLKINNFDTTEFDNLFANFLDYEIIKTSFSRRDYDTTIMGINCYKIIIENISTAGLAISELYISKKNLIPIEYGGILYKTQNDKKREIKYKFLKCRP
jgi:hypothetical protein